MNFIKKYKNKFKNIGMLIMVFFIFYFSSLFQLIPVTIFHIDLKNISDAMGVCLSTFSGCCLLVVLILIYRKELKEEFKTFKNKFYDNLDIGVKCWFIGLIIMMVSNIIIGSLLGAGQAGNEQAVQKMIKSLPWLMVINAGIIAPINEEIIFRKSFKNVFKNKWVFVFMSGFIFGLLHVLGNINNWKDVLYIIPYGSLGSAFAYAYYKTNTIYTSISLHIFHNLVLVISSII